MPLTENQKVDVRRHLGYGVIGLWALSPAGGTLAQAAVTQRYFGVASSLEYKLNALNPGEESRLLGLPVGAIMFTGLQPNLGDTVAVTISGGGLISPVVLNITAGPIIPANDMRLTLCQQLVMAASLDMNLVAAGFYSATPYGTGPLALLSIPLPQVMFVNRNGVAFTLAAVGTGNAQPAIAEQGAVQWPITTLTDMTRTNNPPIVVVGFVPILNQLQGAVLSASQNLDTIKADVWQGRSNEIGLRRSLYRQWQQELSNFLDVPVNPRRRNEPGVGAGAVQYI